MTARPVSDPATRPTPTPPRVVRTNLYLMNIPHLSRRRGFTLIELLTVIAIIGILAAIIIPTVGKVRDTAKTATCTSNIRQVGMSLRMLAEDRKGVLPLPFGNPTATINGRLVTDPQWHQMIEPYLPPRDINSWNQGQHAVMKCPSIRWEGVTQEEVGSGYSLAGGAVGLNGINNDPAIARRLSTIVTPSQAPLLIDGGQQGTSGSTRFFAKYWVRNSDVIPEIAANTNLNADFRHGDAVNVCMADGSVKRIKRSEWATKFPTFGANRGNYQGL